MGYNNTPNVIVQIDNKAIREQQEKADRQTQVINQGTSLITADQTTPLDIQVEGRTLVPLQNSNLESNGTYVLANADKKTKIIVDNKVAAAGVGKFTKNSTLTRKTDFANKVAGSNAETPHNVYTRNGGSFPTAPFQIGTTVLEQNQSSIDKVKTLNGSSLNNVTSASGSIVQHIFSFDIIAEIERNMGIIPGATKAQKIQWCKDNTQNLSFKWYGFGTGPNGPRAWHGVYHSVNNTWTMGWNNHTSPVVQIMTTNVLDFANRIDADGLIHMAAYADASDGVTASQINTDFIEFILDLKTTAQLDTRSQISRVANLEGKVTGSTVENPHLSKGNSGSTTLQTPSGSWAENTQSYYDNVSKLDGSLRNSNTSVNGNITQQIFSFDLIAEVERNLGRIPKAAVPDKIQWLKDNLSKVSFSWWGYGSSAAGNKATLSHWAVPNGNWDYDKTSHTSGSVSKLSINLWATSAAAPIIQPDWAINIRNNIDSNGFIHFLVNSEVCDGVTPSILLTDYAELEFQIKPEASLHDPQVPLYQVDSTEYTKILGEWPEAEVLTRYPKTTGIQHVQNPYVMAEGENMMPPFTEWPVIHGNAKINGAYELELNATAVNENSSVKDIPVVPNQPYSLGIVQTGVVANYKLNFYDATGTRIYDSGYVTSPSITGTTPATAKTAEVILRSLTAGQTIFSNIMLNLGSVQKPFVPKNPSYLFAQVKLGQIGSAKDVLYKQDGWKVKKFIEKDVILDGSYPWSNQVSALAIGHKYFYIVDAANFVRNMKVNVSKYDGKLLIVTPDYQQNADTTFVSSSSALVIAVSNVDSGMGESYIPSSTEIKAYFNGWQAKTVDGSGKPSAWRSLGDGTDAPTQTLAYVSANKAPNYTPYKLSYALATPATEDVSDKVEGDITVAGITQVEAGSGVIVREKVTPRVDGTQRVLVDGSKKWDGAYWATSKSLYPVSKWLKMYKNGVVDEAWRIGQTNNTFFLPAEKFDTTAEYKVTYLVSDRDKLTVNPYGVKATYAKNIRSALEDTVKKVEDNTKDISINVQAVAELYKRIKGLGG